MPKVLRIINRFNLGGPTYNAAYLTKHLPDRYQTILIGGEKDESEESSEFIVRNLGIEPILLPAMKRSILPLNDLKAFLQLRKLIKSHKPDIVHTHASKAGTLGRLAAFSCGVPVVVHTFHGHVFHSYFGPLKTWLYKNIERALALKSTKIIAISPIQHQELTNIHRICSSHKAATIGLGFDLQRFRVELSEKRTHFRNTYHLSDNTVAIGIIGRLAPIKNHPFLLQAIQRLQKECSTPFRFFIIGDGETRQALEKETEQLGIPFQINTQKGDNTHLLTYTGWIKNIDWPLAGLDVITLCSLNEGTPVSLIEAQAAGKPLVSTQVGGIENVVLPNQTALLSKTGDLEGYTQNLKRIIEDSALRSRMSEKGWEFVREKFHYTRLVADMTKLYDELLDKASINKD